MLKEKIKRESEQRKVHVIEAGCVWVGGGEEGEWGNWCQKTSLVKEWILKHGMAKTTFDFVFYGDSITKF